YISLTLDTWSSPIHLPYLGITAHWEIESKISTIVTDNSSNIKKAYNELEIGKRIPYFAHTLQLSIKKELDKIELLADKCKHLITFLSDDKKK
ncbi:2064_t:CDS:2, partial [Funneliformis caledonium]